MSEWFMASAPSNIALIKYMGKSNSKDNKPLNSSLSFTLKNMRTFVRAQLIVGDQPDRWQRYVREDLAPLDLSETSVNRYLQFFQSLKKEFKINGNFLIESGNNFPSDCGLASSASSFAALTLLAHEIYIKQSESKALQYRPKELARLSQKGSGSSCRSFFSPWALWHEAGAEDMSLPYSDLIHAVILCDDQKKLVSSSEAHERVLTSDLFKGRVERAQERLQNLVNNLRQSQWVAACQITWNEFWDMHALFHTSNPSFIYLNATSLEALKELEHLNRQSLEKIMVTMDAGSNIHVLFRKEDRNLYHQWKEQFSKKYNLWLAKDEVHAAN